MKCSSCVADASVSSAAIIPVVMAGVIGIYGFIIAVVVGTKSESPKDMCSQKHADSGLHGNGFRWGMLSQTEDGNHRARTAVR